MFDRILQILKPLGFTEYRQRGEAAAFYHDQWQIESQLIIHDDDATEDDCQILAGSVWYKVCEERFGEVTGSYAS